VNPLRGFRSVVFDCDSTLTSIEGIDELAGAHIAEIRALTAAAMEGRVPLEEVYGRRLQIIRPSGHEVAALGRKYVQRLVEDARETLAALLWLGKDVRIVSGGLRPPVEALARELGVRGEAVAAVDIRFDATGGYADFEHDSPLARGGGKLAVVRDWGLARPRLMVGDGATDLEVRPEVDCFAAYMGVAYRENVAAAADIVLSEESLAPVLALAADPADRGRLEGSRWAETLTRGDVLLAGAAGASRAVRGANTGGAATPEGQ
jgi:phosphoserine phosphatase